MAEPKNGVSVDAKGKMVLDGDPTANVQALSEASNKRQDDLREAQQKYIDAQIDGIKEAENLRADFRRELMTAEARRVNEVLALRAEFQDKLSIAEAKRIDAIRAVDVNAVAVASQRSSEQATVLANQVVQSAEALRTLVATTATTVANSLQQLSTSLSTRLTTLEQGSYQAMGKSAYSDPELAKLLAEVKTLSDAARLGTGKTAGAASVWAVIAGGITVITVLLGIAGFMFANSNRIPPSQPQVIYVPSPAVTPPILPR